MVLKKEGIQGSHKASVPLKPGVYYILLQIWNSGLHDSEKIYNFAVTKDEGNQVE